MNVSATPPFTPHTTDGIKTPPPHLRPQGPRTDTGSGIKPPVTGRGDQPTMPKTPDAPAAPQGDAPSDAFSVDGLLADWGRGDSIYDLDGSGNVDGWDLALFLGGERPAKAEEPEYSVQGLLEQWGQSESIYDLDGNGNVDGWDLGMFLNGTMPGDSSTPFNSADNAVVASGATTEEASAAAAGDASKPDKPAPPGPQDGQAFLDRFTNIVFRRTGLAKTDEIQLSEIKANDNDAAHLDPDGDGIVKLDDLRNFIQKSVAGEINTNERIRPSKLANEWIRRLGGPVENQALVSHPGEERAGIKSKRAAALDRLTSFVGKKLDKAGFDKHPPRNLHAVLGNLNLTGNDKSFVLKQLAARYPNGLGVNRVG